MYKRISSFILVLFFYCLCACTAQDRHADTTKTQDSGIQVTPESTDDSTKSTEITDAPTTQFVSVIDTVPLYDRDHHGMYIIPSAQNNSDVYEATYYHMNTPVRFLRSNLLEVCTDEFEYRQGSRYALYEIVDGEFRPLENKVFSKQFTLFDKVYPIEFEYAVYGDQIILTYVPEQRDIADIRYWKSLNDHTYLLEIANQTDNGNICYYLMTLDLQTQELTNLFSNLDPELQTEIAQGQPYDIVFIAEGQLVIRNHLGYIYYVDLANDAAYRLDELLGMDVENCFVAPPYIVCHADGAFRMVNTADLSFTSFLNGINSFRAGTLDERYDSPYILFVSEQKYHVYDILTGQDQIITPPECWDMQLSNLSVSPDGSMFYHLSINDGQYQILLFDADTHTLTEIQRENENGIGDIDIYWTSDNQIVICAEGRTEYYIYDFK